MFGSSGKSATLAAVSSAAVHTWLRLCLAVLPAVAAGGNFCCVTLKLFFFFKCDDSFFSSSVLLLNSVVFRSTGKPSVLDVDGLWCSQVGSW